MNIPLGTEEQMKIVVPIIEMLNGLHPVVQQQTVEILMARHVWLASSVGSHDKDMVFSSMVKHARQALSQLEKWIAENDTPPRH